MNKANNVWVAVIVALAVGLAAGVWLGRPAYRRFKERRSVNEAEVCMQKGDYRNAFLSLQNALAINPSNIVAVQLMGDLSDNAQSPEALAWRQRLVYLAPTINNRILLAATALHVEKRPFPLAAMTLEAIRPLAETNTAYRLVASQLALRLNRLGEAEAHLRVAAALEPTNRLHQLNLATLRLRLTDTNAANAARAELVQLSSDPALGQAALRSLAAESLTRRDALAAEEYSRRLQTNRQATLDDALLRLTVLTETTNAALKSFLARVQRESATNALQIARVVSWMNGNKLAREAIDWLKALPSATATTMPLPLIEADCYVTLRDWSGLEERLNGQRWGDQDFLRLALTARAAREQRRNELSNMVWHQAVGLASKRNESLAMLAQAAGSWGWTNETEELLWSIVQRAPAEESALRLLLQGYGARDDTAGLYRVFQALYHRHPQSLELKNNVAATGLLLNRDLDRSIQLAREVYEAAPTNAVFASTYAFALLAQSNPAAGLALMQKLPPDDLQQPNVATYYGMLLAASGQPDRSQQFFAVGEKGHLLPEERRLVAAARGATPPGR